MLGQVEMVKSVKGALRVVRKESEHSLVVGDMPELGMLVH
jgi:hypothetical protein